MAVKKTQMYRKNLDTSETNLYPLTEAQYVSMENGQTVQEILSDRDSDKYTPVITNSSSTFKVGQGDNVDLSSSMKEGAYDSCVLKGKTMVNCIQEPSSQDVVLPYTFEEGQSITINDTKESGALGVELKGQTLVNLATNQYAINPSWNTSKDFVTVEDGKITIKLDDNTQGINVSFTPLYTLKPNTKYMIIGDVIASTNNHASNYLASYVIQWYKDGVYKGTAKNISNTRRSNIFTTGDDFNIIEIACYGRGFIGEVTYDFPVVLEYQEGMENWDIPYFEGMASCKMPILSTVGKNLFDYTYWYPLILHNFDYTITGNKINTIIPSGKWFLETARTNFDNLKEDTIYTISATSVNSQITILFWKPDGTLIFERGVRNTPITFTTPNEPFVVSVRFCRRLDSDNTVDVQASCENIQIEEGTVATVYEPYKSSILSLPEEVVLRSLPNGVCDTFNTRTGVYTQRIGERVFYGTEKGWTYRNLSNNGEIAIFSANTSAGIGVEDWKIVRNTKNETVTCDSFVTHQELSGIANISSLNKECFAYFLDSHGVKFIYIAIAKNKASNLTELQSYLASNPVKTQYELETPIVTKINLPSTLKSWNATTHIYSEIPENTLYPILSHSNPTYPVILKPSTKYSIVANSYSNGHTNSAINFNLGGATTSTTVGNRVMTITTPSTLSNELLTMSGRGNKLNNVMIIEGDVVGDEPYFEGICDCKSPILSNVGKNLFDVDDLIKKHSHPSVVEITKTDTGFNMKSKNTGVWHATSYSMQLKPNTQYIFNCIANTKSNTGSIKLWNDCESFHVYRDAFLQNTTNLEINITFTTQKDGVVKFQLNTTRDISVLGDIEVLNVSLYELANQTTYEPYKSNTTTFEQKDDKTIVLRSLPNGVCDTLNVETGEHVQRIGEIVLNGNNDITLSISGSSNNYPNITRVWLRSGELNNLKENVGGNIICNKLPNIGANGDYEKISVSNGIDIHIATSKLSEETPNAVKQYLLQNPIEIQYELATPVVTTIDVQGFPYAYTNGHVQLSSGSIEQSLTPKVEYSLSANKTGQINSNTKRASAHQKQLDDFEAMMLTQMVQSAYDKAILQFDYEMQMMSLGGE